MYEGVIMLKKYIIILMFFGFQLNAMNMNSHPPVEVGGIHRPGFPEFFTSFRDSTLRYQDTLLSGEVPITSRIPLIGHYQNAATKGHTTQGEYYNARVSIALIEHQPTALAAVIPASVRESLSAAGILDLSMVEFYTNIVGDFAVAQEAPTGGNSNSCNVAFHPVLIRWRGTGTAHFNVPLNAGIFEAHGVSEKSGGIAFNRLGALNVNYHGAFSPDNGRFNYDPSRAVATFWIVGVYNGHAIVVFNILATDETTEALLLASTHQTNFDGVLRVMHSIASALSPEDVAVFTDAVSILERSSGHAVRALPVSKPEVAAPSSSKGGHVLGSKKQTAKMTPSQLAYRAAMRRSARTEESTSIAGSSSAVDQSIVDDMAQAFMAHLQQNNIEEALSLLEVIQDLDPDKATVCRFALEEHLS